MANQNGNKQKGLKALQKANVLESLKDIGSGTINSFNKDLFQESSSDFFNEMFGIKPKKLSSDIKPGESLEMKELYAGKVEENKKLRLQMALERQLREEEKARLQQKSNDLKLQLHAVVQEVVQLASATQSLSEHVKIATMQSPANPGPYHIIFFEKLLDYIRSFRKNIEDSSIWLQSTNKRANKKNYWGKYKSNGGKFLLSPDHYLQRSAG